MKLKINKLDKKNKQKYNFTDKDLPLITQFKSANYLIFVDYISLDNIRYGFINLDNGSMQSNKYDTLEDLIDNLGYDEKIVEAELTIDQ